MVWDHCFNALALSKTDLKAGLEQFFSLFEVQEENGKVPDLITSNEIVWSITKPPIHGWCFKKIMDENVLDNNTLKKAYEHLKLWTNWYFEFRDTDNDGVPNYNIGCDSGWG